jgi:hypothetical protein
MTQSDFVASLVAAVPDTQPIVDEHLRDYDGSVLLHLLVADVRRFAIASFEQGETERLRRLLAFVDGALRDGDEAVQNAIAVSFVEDTGWWDPAMQTFIATWPDGLRVEAERQRNHRA